MLMPMIADSEIGVSMHAHLAELVEQPLRDAERAAVRADVLAEHEHLRIAPHLFDERFADRFEVGEFFAHGAQAYRSVTASSGFGSGAFIANSTASSIVDVDARLDLLQLARR